jgi:hypothetical protein
MAAVNRGLGVSIESKAEKKDSQSLGDRVINSASLRTCRARSCPALNRKALTERPAVAAARTINSLISGEVRRSMRSDVRFAEDIA